MGALPKGGGFCRGGPAEDCRGPVLGWTSLPRAGRTGTPRYSRVGPDENEKDRGGRMTPFVIQDCSLLIRMSGLLPAADLRELRDRIAACGENVLFHHFFETPLRPTFDNPDYRNDFAVWAKLYLDDRVLAERLGILDPYSCSSLDEL